MRETLALWAARLADIMSPQPDNLVRFEKEMAR
jgi:hypothetical protein